MNHTRVASVYYTRNGLKKIEKSGRTLAFFPDVLVKGGADDFCPKNISVSRVQRLSAI